MADELLSCCPDLVVILDLLLLGKEVEVDHGGTRDAVQRPERLPDLPREIGALPGDPLFGIREIVRREIVDRLFVTIFRDFAVPLIGDEAGRGLHGVAAGEIHGHIDRLVDTELLVGRRVIPGAHMVRQSGHVGESDRPFDRLNESADDLKNHCDELLGKVRTQLQSAL